jgi:hypothetical protein
MSSIRISGLKRWMGALFVLAFAAQPTVSWAQDFRGSISGRVSDSTNAPLPGVTVTATNTATNVTTTTSTTDGGDYHLLYLTAGTYSVSAELSGFKKASQSAIEVRIGDRVELPLTLELGAQTETIEVVSSVPLLEAGSASAGQVIGEQQLELMPLADGNPFVLARLAPGVNYVSNLLFTRAFDNNAVSGLRSDGGAGRNEFTLDGTPNTASGGEQDRGRVAFVPPSEAVQEFKVETAAFDAQQGHTAGANINVTIKSGTNRFFGSLYAFYRDEKLASDSFFNEKLGNEKDPLSYKRYGGTLGGPLRRDHTFFFLSFEGLKDEFPEPSNVSVPTLEQRNGDFSALLRQGIVLYDPRSARLVGNTVTRTPFPNNQVPVSAEARRILSFFPEPNQPGNADGSGNYFSPNPRKDDFYSITARVDHTISESQKIFVRYSRNDREETRNYFFPAVDGVIPTGTGLTRLNNNATLDHVATFSGTTLLNTRLGFSRFLDSNFRPHEGFDIGSLGFSSNTVGLFGGARYFPQLDLDGYQDLGNPLGNATTSTIYTAQSTLTRIAGAHSFRVGIDLRAYRDDVVNPNNQGGTYQFRNTFTSAAQGATAPSRGGDLVMLLLGIPTGGSIDRNNGRNNEVLYGGIFLQDDWRVSEKLTVNLGLRYDMETGMTEKENRNVRGFDLETPSPLEPAARAAYATRPVPERPVDQFQVRGGYTFLTDENPRVWNADKNNIQPRLGLTYKLGSKTILRAGAGIYYAPFVIDAVNQVGYSQTTNIPTTTNNGLTFPASINTPFSLGVQEPPGASLGLLSNVGRATEQVRPVDRENARSLRFLAGFQQELPGGVLFEANYVGNRGSDIETQYDINPIPAQYLSTSGTRDQRAIDFLEVATFPNPFLNNALIPPTEQLRTSQTLSRARLLRPYPHFQTLNGRFYDGTSTYNAAQLRLEKRFTTGFSLLGAYTYSKFTEKASKLNPTDAEYEERPHFDDARHRVTSSLIWELPIARGASGMTKQVFGGWTVTGLFTYQTGTPINAAGLANRYYNGDPNELKTSYNLDNYDPATTTVRNVFDTTGFYLPDQPGNRNDTRIRLSDATSIRTFPSRLQNYRTMPRPLLDASVIKHFTVSERVKLQMRFEVFNALNFVELNTPNFDPTSPAFGSSNEQSNLPREFQLGMKLMF